MRKYIFLILSVLILCGGVFFYLMFEVVSHQYDYSPAAAEYIVILGHSLEDGEWPSDWLVARMEEGLRLYNMGYAPKIVVSGGQPQKYKISVAESMRRWLVERGVPDEVILPEADAANTYENFKLTYALTGDADIIVVTNDFHMYRSMLTASDYFTEASGSAAPLAINLQKTLAYCKEPLSIIKYITLHRG